LGVRILEIKYEGDEERMLIFMNDDIDGIKEIESGENFEVVKKKLKDVKIEEINIKMNKLKIEK
jgi:hypothetical protein